jgi:hypothetical protein
MAYPYSGHFLPDRVDVVTLLYFPPKEDRAERNADPSKPKTPSSDWAIVGESLGWPMYISDRSAIAPLVGAGLVAFYGAPFIFPFTSVGGALLQGYLAGSLVYFSEFYGHRPVHELAGLSNKNI